MENVNKIGLGGACPAMSFRRTWQAHQGGIKNKERRKL